MDFKTVPFEHQLECYERIKNVPYFALFLEPGLGKTKIALDIASYRKERDGIYTTLVVCPNTITENWFQETLVHSYLSPALLVGTRSKRLVSLSNEHDIYMINYESVPRLEKELALKNFNLLVLDESHYVKNPKSNRAKACFKLSQKIPDKLILTGTPIMNNPLDIFGQYRCLNPLIFGTSFYKFRAHYAVMGTYGYDKYNVKRWINMELFKRRIFSCAVRKTKDECLDLPDKLYQIIKVDMPDEQKKIYRELKENFISEFKDSIIAATSILPRLMRFSQITAGFTKDVEGVEHAFKENPKINWFVDFMSELGTNHKVVVFTRFRREITMVEQALSEINIAYVSLHGGTNERMQRINNFNKDPSIRVFITNPETGGIGINLTSATYAVFLSNSYKYGDRIQAEDRIHRIGQDRNVTYIDILMSNSVDSAIHNALKRKASLADMVIGDVVKIL